MEWPYFVLEAMRKEELRAQAAAPRGRRCVCRNKDEELRILPAILLIEAAAHHDLEKEVGSYECG